MKNFIKNNLKVFVTMIITTIIVGSISVYAASQYFAKDITFIPTNENFKKENGEPIDNVEDALNQLYTQKNQAVLLWTNNNLTNFSAGTVNLDLSKYDYIIIDGYYSSDAGVLSKSLVEKGTSQYINIGTFYNSSTNRAVSQIRLITVNNTGVTFGEQIDYGSNGKTTHGIPYRIWGLKLNRI